MIAETPYPATVSKNTQLVIRYHDAIPLLMPHTISDRRFHQAFHYRALRKECRERRMVCLRFGCDAKGFGVDLSAGGGAIGYHSQYGVAPLQQTSLRPRPRSRDRRTRMNIPNQTATGSDAQAQAVRGSPQEPTARLSCLIVSTIEPRKNHLTLLSAWEKLACGELSEAQAADGRIIGLASQGNHSQVSAWLERGDAFLLEDVLAAELRVLYAHARATICPSFGEGFDFSGVEAMRSGGPVVASESLFIAKSMPTQRSILILIQWTLSHAIFTL